MAPVRHFRHWWYQQRSVKTDILILNWKYWQREKKNTLTLLPPSGIFVHFTFFFFSLLLHLLIILAVLQCFAWHLEEIFLFSHIFWNPASFTIKCVLFSHDTFCTLSSPLWANMSTHKKRTIKSLNLLSNFLPAQNYPTLTIFQDFNPLNARIIIWILSDLFWKNT